MGPDIYSFNYLQIPLKKARKVKQKAKNSCAYCSTASSCLHWGYSLYLMSAQNASWWWYILVMILWQHWGKGGTSCKQKRAAGSPENIAILVQIGTTIFFCVFFYLPYFSPWYPNFLPNSIPMGMCVSLLDMGDSCSWNPFLFTTIMCKSCSCTIFYCFLLLINPDNIVGHKSVLYRLSLCTIISDWLGT